MRGIMFLPEMYAASEAGNKCMTSRMGGLDVVNENPHDWECHGHLPNFGHDVFAFSRISFSQHITTIDARYNVGEILYVKEPWADTNYGIIHADDIPYLGPVKLNNKMFMPASVARRWIRITSIECKRVQDMTEQDFNDEGIMHRFYENHYHTGKPEHRYGWRFGKMHYSSYNDAWAALLDKVKKGTYTLNPWTFRYRYEWLRSLPLKSIFDQLYPITPKTVVITDGVYPDHNGSYEVSMIVSPVNK